MFVPIGRRGTGSIFLPDAGGVPRKQRRDAQLLAIPLARTPHPTPRQTLMNRIYGIILRFPFQLISGEGAQNVLPGLSSYVM